MEEVEEANRAAVESCHRLLTHLGHEPAVDRNLRAATGESVGRFKRVVSLLGNGVGHARVRRSKKVHSSAFNHRIFLDNPLAQPKPARSSRGSCRRRGRWSLTAAATTTTSSRTASSSRTRCSRSRRRRRRRRPPRRCRFSTSSPRPTTHSNTSNSSRTAEGSSSSRSSRRRCSGGAAAGRTSSSTPPAAAPRPPRRPGRSCPRSAWKGASSAPARTGGRSS
ncbi:protein WRKY1-like [Iris pallida]|uniref:Protein WRKY1-like n=1 Tax=Iris pallida TaxID=29817 RepID=A0AAX6H7S4_IRIPA|nr:protein WRKY1-like [Iris pallida]